MVRNQFTPVQYKKQWEDQLALEVSRALCFTSQHMFPRMHVSYSIRERTYTSSHNIDFQRSQSHHESALPSQRYKARDALPAGFNPINPAELKEEDVGTSNPNLASFDELNVLPPRPPMLGNPIFGYSVHPLPLKGPNACISGEIGGDLSGGAARQRMRELQEQLEQERRARKQLEQQLRLS